MKKDDDIEIYIDKIIRMLETDVLINDWDANVGVGPGDYSFGDVRIPSDRVLEFIEVLRLIRKDESGDLREEINKLKKRVEIYLNKCDELQTMMSFVYCGNCPDFVKGMDGGESGMGTCLKLNRTITWQQWCILKDVGCGLGSRSIISESRETQELDCGDYLQRGEKE